MKRYIIPAAKLILAALLVTWLVSSGRLEFSRILSIRERWQWVVASCALVGVVLVAAAWRWQLFLRAQGIRYSFSESYVLTLIGFFFSQVMLGIVGGDTVKAYVVAMENPTRRSAAVISVIFDRAFGLGVLLVIAVIAGAYNWNAVGPGSPIRAFVAATAGLLACGVVGGALFYSRRVQSFLERRGWGARLPGRDLLLKFREALLVYRQHPRILGGAFVLTAMLHVCVILAMYCAAAALIPGELPIASFFVVVPLANVAMAVPITPGAIGTGEAACDYLFARCGMSRGGLVLVVLRVVYFAWAGIGCLLYLRRRTSVREAVKIADSDGDARGEGANSASDPHQVSSH